MSQPTETLLDVAAIEALIPHRAPFLLVDRVVELERRKRIRALKAVTFNEPFFRGHFPDHPVMPGVLVVEAMAQAAGILVCEAMEPEVRKGKVMYFMGIDKARFRKPVRPGCLLDLRCELVRSKGAIHLTRGEAYVEEQLCCEAEFMAMIADRES